MRKSIKAWAFLAPSFIGVILFVLIPFGDTVRRSFFEAMSDRIVGVDNYISIIHNKAF